MWGFGEVEVDSDRREFRRAGTMVHLEPQAFDLLVCLIERRDHVVSKAELLDGVWGHRFVSEANLTTRVKEVRRAVGDDGNRQHTIMNIRGRGYRFVADVVLLDKSASCGTDPELVGRDDDLAALLAALEGSRIVTVTGPGGVGKSTLARVTVANIPGSRWDGTHIVELAGLEPDASVLPAVAHALDIVFDNERADDAVRSIGRLRVLLVLDNCEHVIDETGLLTDRLIHDIGARIQILATSQFPLAVSGEALVPIRPLTGGLASELFRRRARAALPSWDDTVAPDRIDRMVARLDGLPLTIEMAAARVRSMTLDDLERVILDDTGLLQVTHRTPARRHRSLVSLVTWSAELLEPRHHQTFIEFSVFAGTVTAADASAVLGPADPRAAVLDLAALAERSLLVADVTGNETRYSMLSTIRTVAGRWLDESGAAHDAHRRHAEHVAAVLKDVDEELRTPQEAAARRRLAALVDEVRAAHRWAGRDDPDLASAMSGAVFHAAYTSMWNEPAEWSRTLLTAHAGQEARFEGALLILAGAAAHRGELGLARKHAAGVASTSSGRNRTIALELLADIALYEGDLDGAARAAHELERLGLELGDPHARALAVVDAALARVYANDPAGGLFIVDAADLGELAPTDRAWLAFARGDALSMLRAPDASDSFRQAIALGRAVGNHYIVSVSHVALATDLARAGDLESALGAYASAFDDFLRHGDQTHAVIAIRNLVGLLGAIGDDRGATVLAGAVSDDHLQRSYGTEAERVNDVLAEVRHRVGTNRFKEWFDEGRALDSECVLVAIAFVEQHRTRILSESS